MKLVVCRGPDERIIEQAERVEYEEQGYVRATAAHENRVLKAAGEKLEKHHIDREAAQKADTSLKAGQAPDPAAPAPAEPQEPQEPEGPAEVTMMKEGFSNQTVEIDSQAHQDLIADGWTALT